jgi:hypothetical protein
MKKIIVSLLLISFTHQAFADGASDTLVPMVMGGGVCCTQAVLTLAVPLVTKKKSPSSI